MQQVVSLDPLALQDKKTQCIYTHCYCEENIWKLCERMKTENPLELDNCYAIFLSSEKSVLPMWYQKDNGELIVWDYHVILIHKGSNSSSTVYDFDTRLPFPTSFSNYVFRSWLVTYLLPNPPKRLISMINDLLFRIVPAREYLETFSSDRSHMWNAETNSYSAPPPSYPCIQGNTSTRMNLDDFRMMNQGKKEQVYTLNGLCELFGMGSVQTILEEHCKHLTTRKTSNDNDEANDDEENLE
ncbi:hypothetical protein C9374_004817 [Naegleria lovaniensis]|uniref:Protein N-terminal glutamine amidohydrolase n=1 Tax=Naegleria lovaniensis TaxID=51637 RepID=A0AA88KKQ8_NAELO|nr:uncharacterized protein C9374_004817 [Naegleria lovaniensis]KAG2382850.1 hypothetical protein C9374_004817 [Naegleria lovaniensis]